MRNILKLGVILAFLITGVCFFATRETWATAASTNAASFDGSASPRSLYIQNCARCHGADGKAQTTLGRKLEAADLTSADVKEMSSGKITRTIRNGRLEMPAFGKKLKASQIASLVGYVRSL